MLADCPMNMSWEAASLYKPHMILYMYFPEED